MKDPTSHLSPPTSVRLGHFLSLTKPRIVGMVLVTTTIGYLLGSRGEVDGYTLLCMLMGTAAAAGGSAVLNNYLDRDLDARMERTSRRPLPSGAVPPGSALSFGALLVLGGVSWLVWQVNLQAAFLVLLTAFLYVVVYTPLKRVTWLNTSIGAIPGALPPLNGWVAASGDLGPGAWILFLILFAWQHPHFYAIAWMYREDYARAGFRMLPVVEPSGRRMFRHIVFFLVMLLAVSLLPTVAGLTGRVYLAGALLAGGLFLATGVTLARSRARIHARHVLRASVVYLPALLTLILADLTF